MSPKILGISGSPIKDSNTDRLIQAVLDSSGRESEFVKLSSITVRPCLGCKKCVPDNICKVKDDFPELAEKIKTAGALVIGAYTPYSQIDGFTKALLERFWSLRHVENVLQGKLAASVVTGCMPQVVKAVSQSLAVEFQAYENMELVGQVGVQGNIPCAFCGRGDDCKMSAVEMIHGQGTNAGDVQYERVEAQENAWKEANLIGRRMGEQLKA